MQNNQSFSLIVPEGFEEILEQALERYDLNEINIFKDLKSAQKAPGYDPRFSLQITDSDNTDFLAPMRLGALIDRIRSLTSAAQRYMHYDKDITFGPFSFSVKDSLLKGRSEDIRLTEKERDLLLCLYESKGAIVMREEILENVWGYAEDLETHTLETHIYRLRQKIEIDPAEPEILLTAENGYRLGFLAVK